ncbi:MAG TPA: CBS domain-containing protein [Dissulfurispiraceae bacterium]|nr:CBS domain-containing protein [Dissulfurispiraceae bacterium]
MALFGELFLSEIIKKPVFDPKGEIIGRVKDVIVVKGDPLPEIAAVIVHRKGQQHIIKWAAINIFNKRIISSFLYADSLQSYEYPGEDLLAVRDILDKQIVDANGAKVVRVNDIKLEGYNGSAVLIAVDVGMRGILRRLGAEHSSDEVLRFFKTRLSYNLISWNYMQPLSPELKSIALTVPRQMLSDLHPADIADLISQVSREEGAHLFKDLDIETAAEALSELMPERQAEIISSIDTEQAADIIEEMQPDEAADVLSDLPTEKAKEILEHIDKEEAEDIQELLGHEEGTAGGLMTNVFIAYPPQMTVSEAIERFKKDAEEIESVYYIYVMDENEKLVGVASLRDIIMADPNAALAEVMETKLKSVTPETDDRVVAELISKYNLVALPVVDAENVLLGIVSVDDVIDIILPPSAKRGRRKV